MFRNLDLQRDGKYAEHNRMYRLWFQMLRLSPSYELARRFRAENGNLSTQDQARLPEDFDLVLAVYDDFGDLNRSHFSDWWLDCGLQLFGSKGKAPKVSPIAKIQHDDVDQKFCFFFLIIV